MSSMGEFYASVVELGKVGRNLVFGRCKSLPFFIVLGNSVFYMRKTLQGMCTICRILSCFDVASPRYALKLNVSKNTVSGMG